MKYPVIFFLFFLVSLNGFSQPAPRKVDLGKLSVATGGIPYSDYMVNPDWKSLAIQSGVLWGTYGGIKGNAFYADAWNKGYVLLGNNSISDSISLNFNIYTNEIYFLRDSQVLVLNVSEPLEGFGIYSEDGDSSLTAKFRCGYPSVENNTSKTFYRVLVQNKISLLKQYNRSIMERTDPTGVPEKIFTGSETYFVYNAAENKIIAINKNKNSIVTALPAYTQKIESVILEKKLKLKKEEELITLISEINN